MIKNRKKECTRHRHAYVCVYMDAYSRVIGCDCVYSCVCAREREREREIVTERVREFTRVCTCVYIQINILLLKAYAQVRPCSQLPRTCGSALTPHATPAPNPPSTRASERHFKIRAERTDFLYVPIPTITPGRLPLQASSSQYNGVFVSAGGRKEAGEEPIPRLGQGGDNGRLPLAGGYGTLPGCY